MRSFIQRNAVILLISGFCLTFLASSAQDTFSIVAIDSVTGLFGSAGASCVGSSGSYPHGAQILSDVIPGIGVIHTQAAWNHVNQDNAHNWMMLGLSPKQIIDSLVANDAQNNSTTRQYGIVDFNGGHPRSAAFTGINCQNYKNDTANLNYSIQGNILMGQRILDSMQTRFLNDAGTFADRLMASLQGAKIIGADTRCAVRNTSSQSAFIRVGRMTDSPDSLYLDLWMAYPQNYTGTFPVDPIDSLQTLYDIWKTSVSVRDHSKEAVNPVKIRKGSENSVIFDLTSLKNYDQALLVIYDILGMEVASKQITSRVVEVALKNSPTSRILIYSIIRSDQTLISKGKFLF
jgi:uncharacterized Ntn-hydrolase superfamily protein